MKTKHYFFESVAALLLLCLAMVLGLVGSVVLFDLPVPFMQDLAIFLLQRPPSLYNALPFLGAAIGCVLAAFWFLKD